MQFFSYARKVQTLPYPKIPHLLSLECPHSHAHSFSISISLFSSLYSHLNIPVNEPVDFKVIIILAKGVDQTLGNLEPTHVEEKL